ncbi:MAG: TSUP family transporter, partial [Pseudoalteromonas spongiae]
LVVFVALLGGIVSGLIGSGADIAIFALLMLHFKADLKVATATSVIVMAVTSVFASGINLLYLNAITAPISQYVLAAIPVVVIGAPLGAYCCAKVPKSVLLSFLLMLIGLEVAFTLYEIIGNL